MLVKLPYTTNMVYAALSGVTDVIKQIQVVQNKYKVYKDGYPSYLIPYVMVQPKLKNKQEYKVCLVTV